MGTISLIDHLCNLLRGKPLKVHLLNMHLLIELFMKLNMSLGVHVNVMTSINSSLVHVLLN